VRRLVADERGGATILAAFAIAAIASVLVAVLHIGGAVVARHRAQSAADLAALAAAAAQVAGGPDSCAAARDLARAQQPPADVIDCRVTGSDVVVAVRVPVALGAFGVRWADARARAGPVR